MNKRQYLFLEYFYLLLLPNHEYIKLLLRGNTYNRMTPKSKTLFSPKALSLFYLPTKYLHPVASQM